ncbi:EamA family transporter RarD [Ferrimonas lipolytica]|uniref:EamA family transporter RarD n=1 Tax=Ferrimonas lipolytica TaxID=2724191 RepID=A0A6H1UFV8_9GAMM|nr:EamA family transporter RarD [Ferrimonas lipolytica]QIZ77987.1 EamA family transporter RarD [Ferrimonas lipolytica]
MSLLSSLMYGIIPWYVTAFVVLDGTALFYCRVTLVFACLASLMVFQRGFNELARVIANPKVLALVLLGGVLNASQWWLFVWAPVNGLTKELSLGFFLLPLTMALAGRMWLKESLSQLQRYAIAIAILGVAVELFCQGELSWVTLSPALVFPVYFLLRRSLGISACTGLFIEVSLFTPLALYGLATTPQIALNLTQPSFLLWLVGFALLASGSMLSYLAASQRLPISLFGLLSYLEPTLLFLVAIVVLQEPMALAQIASYGLIGIATVIVMLDTSTTLRRQLPC